MEREKYRRVEQGAKQVVGRSIFIKSMRRHNHYNLKPVRYILKNLKTVDISPLIAYNTRIRLNAVTGISSVLRIPTESCRSMRGAGESTHEYLPELRTERIFPSRLRRGAHVTAPECCRTLAEADGASLLRKKVVTRVNTRPLHFKCKGRFFILFFRQNKLKYFIQEMCL